MTVLSERVRVVSDLTEQEIEHLRALCSSWQVLADLSFSDLLLFVQDAGGELFEICAQLRPFTSQTLYPQDMVGRRFTQPEQPVVERAFREGTIWAQRAPVLVDGVAIRMDAVPVRHDGNVIAVLTREGSPSISRRLGRLERVYLDAGDEVSRMVCDGSFPMFPSPPGEWPRVGDGLFMLDGYGRVTWASPNALSSLHRLGVTQNAVGRWLDDLGLGESPVARALTSHRLVDGELVNGDTVVALRVMPVLKGDKVTGAFVIARDVSELRQKERVISVKDATIREIHHRVKNNLQTIASLLRLQSRRLKSDEAKDALEESVLRIGSIALVHETLSEGPSDVADFDEVARRIAHMVNEGLSAPGHNVEMKVVGGTGPVRAEVATPLAVILAELLQNALEHAFPNGRSGTVGVDVHTEGSRLSMTVWDDGIGMPLGPAEGARLGLQIVRTLTEEMGGELAFTSNGGTRIRVTVPIAPA
jgi:two-component system, sensor histidine kinase PdtaS